MRNVLAVAWRDIRAMFVSPIAVLASKFNILSVPFLFIFDGGQMRESFPGGMQKHELMLKMAHFL